MHTGFWSRNLWERDHFEELDVDWRTVLNCIFKTLDGGMKWINLAPWCYFTFHPFVGHEDL